jgi:hypothetical protein
MMMGGAMVLLGMLFVELFTTNDCYGVAQQGNARSCSALKQQDSLSRCSSVLLLLCAFVVVFDRGRAFIVKPISCARVHNTNVTLVRKLINLHLSILS